MVDAPSIIRRSLFFGSYGESVIWFCITLIALLYSDSCSSFQFILPLPCASFLSMFRFSGRLGYHLINELTIPHHTWSSFLVEGFFSSKKVCILFSLGTICTTSVSFFFSALIADPANSTSSLMIIFDGFNLRFLSSQYFRNTNSFFFSSSKVFPYRRTSSMFFILSLPSYLISPSVKKLNISDAEHTPCANTRYL